MGLISYTAFYILPGRLRNSLKMPIDIQTNGLRRNDDAMKTNAGIKKYEFIQKI
jgi:hypothetical protein